MSASLLLAQLARRGGAAAQDALGPTRRAGITAALLQNVPRAQHASAAPAAGAGANPGPGRAGAACEGASPRGAACNAPAFRTRGGGGGGGGSPLGEECSAGGSGGRQAAAGAHGAAPGPPSMSTGGHSGLGAPCARCPASADVQACGRAARDSKQLQLG